MGRIIDVAALVLLFSVGSRTLAPQYSPGLRGTLLLLLADFVVISLYRAFIYPKFFSPLRHLATPPDSHWFWGQTRIIWREPSGIPHSRWIDEVPNDGIIKYNNWFMDRVFISSPKALGEVLVTKSYDFVKPAQIRRTLASILGVGILLAEGDEHRRQRKMLMPAFAFRHIKELYPAFWAKSHQLVDTLAKASRSEESREHKVGKTVTTHAPGIIEVYEQASKATLDIIGASGMGHDFNTLENPDNRLTRAYASIFSIGEARSVIFRLMTIFIPPWIIDNLPMRRNKTLGTAMSEIQQVCQDLVDESREALREKPDSRRDIISVALESGGFNDEELRNQMTTFLLAGHETTSTSLTWAIYLLCKHPDVQAKLRAEIRASIPPLARSREVTSAHIDDCHYLQAVCSEVLRLWSPVPMTMRVTANDTSVSGHFIPKGTLVVLATWAVNRAVSFWGPDAKQFRPERWLDATGRANNRGGAESNYSFLTFLHGPRSCIGQKFAEAEFACLLAAWVGRYETEFEQGSVLARDEEPEIKGGITTKPRDGVWVKLTEVEGW